LTLVQPGGLVRYLSAHTLEEYFGDEMREAVQERDALIGEIKAICESPGELLGAVGEEYHRKFKIFLHLSSDSRLAIRFQAGRVFGELLFDVLELIGTRAAAVTAFSRIPRLIRLARLLGGRFARRGMRRSPSELSGQAGLEDPSVCRAERATVTRVMNIG
jgi:hypothetical protein